MKDEHEKYMEAFRHYFLAERRLTALLGEFYRDDLECPSRGALNRVTKTLTAAGDALRTAIREAKANRAADFADAMNEDRRDEADAATWDEPDGDAWGEAEEDFAAASAERDEVAEGEADADDRTWDAVVAAEVRYQLAQLARRGRRVGE
jgi:hypothetical protein